MTPSVSLTLLPAAAPQPLRAQGGGEREKGPLLPNFGVLGMALGEVAVGYSRGGQFHGNLSYTSMFVYMYIYT